MYQEKRQLLWAASKRNSPCKSVVTKDYLFLFFSRFVLLHKNKRTKKEKKNSSSTSLLGLVLFFSIGFKAHSDCSRLAISESATYSFLCVILFYICELAWRNHHVTCSTVTKARPLQRVLLFISQNNAVSVLYTHVHNQHRRPAGIATTKVFVFLLLFT